MINDTIYAVIGIGARDNTKYHVLAGYSIRTDNWIRIDSTRTPVNDPAVAVINRSIYVMGGFMKSGNNYWNVDSVKEFNIDKKQWTLKAQMPNKRHAAYALIINSKIYVFGGVDESFGYPPSITVQVFDPFNNSWTTNANAISPLAYFRGSRISDRIYFFFENKVSVYDIDSNKWSMNSPIHFEGSYFAHSAFKNTVVLFGGADSTLNLNKVYEYLPDDIIIDIAKKSVTLKN